MTGITCRPVRVSRYSLYILNPIPPPCDARGLTDGEGSVAVPHLISQQASRALAPGVLEEAVVIGGGRGGVAVASSSSTSFCSSSNNSSTSRSSSRSSISSTGWNMNAGQTCVLMPPVKSPEPHPSPERPGCPKRYSLIACSFSTTFLAGSLDLDVSLYIYIYVCVCVCYLEIIDIF